MAATIGLTRIAEADAFGVERGARLPLAAERHGSRKRTASALETATMQINVMVFGIHSVMDDVDNADERCRSVCDRRRAAHHLDTLNIVQVQRCQSGVVGAAPWNSVNH